MAAFATSLVVSNIIAVKLIIFGPFTLPAAPFWTANTYDTVEEAQRASTRFWVSRPDC
jgi:hypothetical protein